MSETTEEKTCTFKGCGKPITGPFPLCEDCRTIENRNIVTLLMDPETPAQFLVAGVNKFVTQLTGPEMIARCARMEAIYLEFKKLMFQYGITENTKRISRTLSEQVEEGREIGRNIDSRAKQIKKKDKKKQSVAKLLGVSEKDAEKWMNEDIDL